MCVCVCMNIGSSCELFENNMSQWNNDEVRAGSSSEQILGEWQYTRITAWCREYSKPSVLASHDASNGGMAQRQRVWLQIRRLGVRISLPSFCSMHLIAGLKPLSPQSAMSSRRAFRSVSLNFATTRHAHEWKSTSDLHPTYPVLDKFDCPQTSFSWWCSCSGEGDHASWCDAPQSNRKNAKPWNKALFQPNRVTTPLTFP